jgi:endonuclease YncB( thermonuclease family)
MDNFISNAEALERWRDSGAETPLRLPIGRLAASGAVPRALSALDDRALMEAYRTTLEGRTEALFERDDESARQRHDGLELGRRALAAQVARRGLVAADVLAEDAEPLRSDRARQLPNHARLDPGGLIQAGSRAAHAEVLDSQRRSFFDRLFNRPQGISAVEAIDGDSVRLDGLREGRLFGIDAPEMPGEAGKRARAQLQKLLAGGPLQVKMHGQDPYGRALVTLYAGGTDVNRQMVAEGYARAYGRYSKRYWGAQMKASVAGKGLWADGWLKHPERQRRRAAEAR